MVTETIKIEGMSCMHCVGRVEKALKSIQGVEKVEVSLEGKNARIDYNESKTGTSKFKKAVEEAGYQVP